MTELRSGATGKPAYSDLAEQLGAARRQAAQRDWHDATPDVRDAAEAFREVVGTPEQRQAQRDDETRRRARRSTFL